MEDFTCPVMTVSIVLSLAILQYGRHRLAAYSKEVNFEVLVRTERNRFEKAHWLKLRT